MQISSRFTIAIHMMTCMETFKEDYKITSDFLASSINVNPVIIRRILSQFKRCRADRCEERDRRGSGY